jgi:isoleucyl-tRNA synthetase
MSDIHNQVSMNKSTKRALHGRENDSVEVAQETQKSDVALREEAVQAFWREHDTFQKSVAAPAGAEPIGTFTFYDGPPFATGLPHYGHILAGTIKDAIPRFWTMNGYRVERKWGWDCHGLPLENLIEKRLGLATKRDIEAYGIKNFNEAARDAVLEYADDWRTIIPRMGRWADMDDDYKTMDSTYTESVWWVFKQLHEKGLVFEGFKTMHLCPRCGTTLSNFEVNQGYKDIKDIAVTVPLKLIDDADGASLLVWTTTPWTLPGNLMAAVNEAFTYAKVRVTIEDTEQLVILAKERLAQLGTDSYEIVEEMPGSDLVGRRYQPPFPWIKEVFDGFREQEKTASKGSTAVGEVPERQFFEAWDNSVNAFIIRHADYVELGEDGTGAVHIAPAYGEDDMMLAQQHGVPIVHHVDEAGHFKPWVTDFAGQLVKPKDDDTTSITHLDADIEIVKALKATGSLFRKENITHSYPHCWRCDTPLLNYATTSWFVDVPSIREQLVANNNEVNWVPEHVGRNRFGKWLEGARDWAVSRQRYWGAPLPIWKNSETCEYKVIGSLAELQEYVPPARNTYLAMRHGEAESNLERLVSSDPTRPDDLTETGRAQAVAAAKALQANDQAIDLVITSPFARTRATAELVRETLGLQPESLIEHEAIGETRVPSEYEGQPWANLSEFFATPELQYDNPQYAGESTVDLKRRAGAFFAEIEAAHQGKNILLVTHKGMIRALKTVAEAMDRDSSMREQVSEIENAEVVPLPYQAFPHNDNYELDFHRPYIDEVVLEEDGVQLERVPDVFDCWFESGSMPYAQHGVPNRLSVEDFESNMFPADFISESVDQTRGWFYSLMVLGTALFGVSPFKNSVTNGLVLAEDGRKMSKSLQNYPDPVELVHRQGADTMRFYLLSSPIIRGEDLNFSEKEVAELQRKNIGRLHNVLALYETYAGEGGERTAARDDSNNVLDTWIIARLNELIAESTVGYQNYELDRATRPLTDFIDDLSVWYVRRSRERLKSADADDRDAALGTLRYVLQHTALVMAPAMPFYAEHLWRAVRSEDDAESVHLAAWPTAGAVDAELLTRMQETRSVVTEALQARTKAGIKVRQPILSVFGPELTAAYAEIVLDELNAKAYEPAPQVSISTELTPELLAEGAVRELMRAVQSARKTAGLQPHDRITLNVETDETGQAAIDAHSDLVRATVGADTIEYAGQVDGEAVSAGAYQFTFSVTS